MGMHLLFVYVFVCAYLTILYHTHNTYIARTGVRVRVCPIKPSIHPSIHPFIHSAKRNETKRKRSEQKTWERSEIMGEERGRGERQRRNIRHHEHFPQNKGEKPLSIHPSIIIRPDRTGVVPFFSPQKTTDVWVHCRERDRERSGDVRLSPHLENLGNLKLKRKERNSLV